MARKTTFHSRSMILGALALVMAALPTSAQDTSPRPATHTVNRGDTLWDLARAYLGDAMLWPQLYRLNTSVVEDPHWIYPGEVLNLSARGGESAVPTEEGAAQPGPVVADAPEEAVPVRASQDPGEFYEYPMPEFARRRVADLTAALTNYVDQTYRPLRPGEFYSSGFLTEHQTLPFGQLLGAVTPQQIRNLRERTSATLYSTVAVLPPAGGAYALGDSLLVVQLGDEWREYGSAVVPTGLVRITGRAQGQFLGEVVAVYGPIRDGQLVLPAERFSAGPAERAVPVDDGLSGTVIGGRELRELKHPLNVLFIDRGRQDDVRPGDLFEIRRRPEARAGAADAVDELMAMGQVVRVGSTTSTLLLLHVVSPDISPGTPVLQVARLPAGVDR